MTVTVILRPKYIVSEIYIAFSGWLPDQSDRLDADTVLDGFLKPTQLKHISRLGRQYLGLLQVHQPVHEDDRRWRFSGFSTNVKDAWTWSPRHRSVPHLSNIVAP